MGRKSEYKLAIKSADKQFSIFIRLRDSNKQGYAKCCTCWRKKHWKKMDCGHYIKRQFLSTRWDERNCAIQCKSCNKFEQGAQDKHAEYIRKKYGQKVLDELEFKHSYEKRHKTKFYVFELQKIACKYKLKTEKLLKERSGRENNGTNKKYE